MPTGQPHCLTCHDNLFVRAEKVISGRRVNHAFYCGRCGLEWMVETEPPPSGEQRHAERRKVSVKQHPERRKIGFD